MVPRTTKWEELLVILTKIVDKRIITEEDANALSWQERVRLIITDPITCR